MALENKRKRMRSGQKMGAYDRVVYPQPSHDQYGGNDPAGYAKYSKAQLEGKIKSTSKEG